MNRERDYAKRASFGVLMRKNNVPRLGNRPLKPDNKMAALFVGNGGEARWEGRTKVGRVRVRENGERRGWMFNSLAETHLEASRCIFPYSRTLERATEQKRAQQSGLAEQWTQSK